MIRQPLNATIETAAGPSAFTGNYYAPQSGKPRSIYICIAGGGLRGKYFDLGIADGFDYSFASRMCALGHGVLTIDHPGTGENPLPAGHRFFGLRQMAEYIYAALSQWEAAGPLKGRALIGTGHSMGGILQILIQGKHAPYSGLCLMGVSAGGLEWALSDLHKSYFDKPEDFERDLEMLSQKMFGVLFSKMPGLKDGSKTFGGDSPAVNDLLRACETDLFSPGGLFGMVRGSFGREIDAVTVPVYLAFGADDIGTPAREVPSHFKNVDNIALSILPGAGHNSLGNQAMADFCTRLDRFFT